MKSKCQFDFELSLLHREIASSDLLSGDLARYRPLLADGLRFFLQRLSTARLRRIFNEQERLPLSTPTDHRLVDLLHHLPALHKLGQVAARDRRLNPAFRRQLQRLESLQPRAPALQVRRLLGKELPNFEKRRIRLHAAPLAEGSVAIVLPFSVFSANRGGSSQEGVFKMLKPGIAGLLDEDLEILGALGGFLDADCERYHLPAIDYQDTFETLRDLLLHEVRLDEEQAHLAEAARLYASQSSVVIPGLLPFCTPRLTAMERLEGSSLGASPLPPPAVRAALANTLIQALIARPFFCEESAALFHADPHAGNLLATPDGRLGILDWSLAGRLRKEARIQFSQILLGALARAPLRIERALQALASQPSDGTKLRALVQAALDELRGPALPGLSWLARLLDSLVHQAALRVQSDLLLFRKTLLTLEGVLSDLLPPGLGPAAGRIDKTLLLLFLAQLFSEAPLRLLLPVSSRALPSHLSTADLWTLLSAAPILPARVWKAVTQMGMRIPASPEPAGR